MRPLLGRRAARTLLILLGLLAGLLAGEAAVRMLDPEGVGIHVKDPVLGQRYRPGYRGAPWQAEAGQRVEVRINALGFRDLERDPARRDARRVVVLGDSFLAGLSVPFADNLTQVCERRLAELTGERFEVVNLGVAGFGTAQEMLAYQELGRRFAPEVVVLLFFAGNDVSDNSSELSTNPRPYFRLDRDGRLEREPQSRLRRDLSAWLNRHSRLYLWQKHATARLAQRWRKTVVLNPVHRVFLAGDDARVERAWAITRALVRELKARVEADGAHLLVVHVPFSDEVDPAGWQETLAGSAPMRAETWDLGKPERRLREICLEVGIDLLAPRAELLAGTERGQPSYFRHGHFNPEGHRRIGERVAERVAELSAAR